MENVIIIAVLLLVLGGAIVYIVRAKKRGTKCIGCPAAACCPSKNGKQTDCGCGCHCEDREG